MILNIYVKMDVIFYTQVMSFINENFNLSKYLDIKIF